MKTDRFPTFRRFGKFLARCLRRLRRIFLSRRSAVVYVSLITLGWLAISIDRWHGRRAWAAEKERLAAAGESLDLRDFLPARPPDEENFFAIPLLQPSANPDSPEAKEKSARLRMWFRNSTIEVADKRGHKKKEQVPFPRLEADTPLREWCDSFRRTGALPPQPLDPDPAKELLLSAAQWKDVFENLYMASRRPLAVALPIPTERPGGEANVGHWPPLARALTLHGLASVSTGDFPTALADILVLEKFAQGQANEPGIFSVFHFGLSRHYVREILRAGMRRHGWSAEQLRETSGRMEAEGILALIRAAVGMERREVCSRWEKCDTSHLQFITVVAWVPDSVSLKAAYAKLAPDGPFLRHCALLSEAHSRMIAGLRPPAPPEGWSARLRYLAQQGFPHLFGNCFGDGIGKAFHRALCVTQLAAAACALERHYLTHHRYPATLSEISPALPPEALLDIDGQPLRYRTAADGSTFRLWSLGWNSVDDSAAAKGSDDLVFSTE